MRVPTGPVMLTLAVGLLLLVACAVPAGPLPAATLPPTAVVVATTTPGSVETATPATTPTGGVKWLRYSSTAGQFMLAYPPGLKILENRKPSVDGVLAAAPDSVTLVNPAAPGFILNIHYAALADPTTAEAYANTDDPCVAATAPEAIVLGRQPAVRYVDTPCGPSGLTAIYLVQALTAYRITIESTEPYQDIAPMVGPILDTFQSASK